MAVLVLAVTALLAVLTWQANARSERRLLDRQLAQVGTLLGQQAAVLRVTLADVGQVAVNTDANPNAFARFAAGELTQSGQALTLWRVSGGQAQQLAAQGVDAWLPPSGAAALTTLKPTGQLEILGILPGRDGKPDRLAYGVMPPAPNTDLVVYAESPLPAGHRMSTTGDSPLAGLDVALYLGATDDPKTLLEATAPTPISGATQRLTVPFGTAKVTMVGTARSRLTGGLPAALPWIVAGVGLLLAAAGAAVVETTSRRRDLAERLYRQQRGIASALQEALLPDVPTLHGVEADARYVAGVDALDVGGDWFDLIERRPGCVAFVVGDVSGRGLRAATTMAALRFATRGYLVDGDEIGAVLSKLRRLLDIDVDQQFATVLLGELDVAAGRLRLVSAGHLPPLLLDCGGPGERARLLATPPGPPVGVPDPDAPTVTDIAVSGPATLVAFTDGLVERRGETIDDGLDRLRGAAAAVASRPLPEMLDELLSALTVEGRKDDTVLLGMRWAA